MDTFIRTTSLAEAQNWRCCYCGFVMLSATADRAEKAAVLGATWSRTRDWASRYRRVTREHLTPRCEGGDESFENQVAACAFCNEYRGNRPFLEAQQRIQRLVRRGTHPHQIWHAHHRFPRMKRLASIQRSTTPFPDLPPAAVQPREPTGGAHAPANSLGANPWTI